MHYAGVLDNRVPIAFIDWAFLWTIDIPGSPWLAMTMAAIPLAMAMAVKRHAETSPDFS